MDMTLTTVLVALLSYLLGAVPFGLVITKLAGLGDIRDIGSGNIGATNVLRTGRKDLALATLILDIGKGAIAVLLTRYGLNSGQELAAIAGTAAFVGHCFPVYLKFKGGKGVATFMGTVLAINPVFGLMVVAAWLLTALIFRISSLAALVAAFIAPFAAFHELHGKAWIAVLFMTVVIYIRHRENIVRLFQGAEPRIGAKKNK